MPGSGDLVLIEGELRSEFEERQNNRKRQVAFRALQREPNIAVPLAAAAAAATVATVAVATASETLERDEEVPETTMDDANSEVNYYETMADVNSEDNVAPESTMADMDWEVGIEPETQFPAEAQQDADKDVYFTQTLDNIVSICGPNDEGEI
ncbi:hypothetical protein MHU86_1933 [Fragilaria crotonensis]|nr:hypothetical protein MHU86_1933 [Fragilaria crotonensis]